MKGLDDIVRRAFPTRKDIEEKKRRRLCAVVGGARGFVTVGLAAALVAACFLFFVTCNIDSPYTDLLMEKVSDDSELEDESKDELEGARGILDESFGTGGVVTHHSAAGGGHNDNGDSVCVDGNGRILVAGYSWNGSDHDMAVWRYLEDGSLDASFGDDGVVTHHNAAGGGGGDYGHSVCVDRSGRILVAGGSSNGSNYDMALWRYLENGSLDTSFGTGGVATYHSAAGGDSTDVGYSVCVDMNGRILVAGYSSNGNDHDMALWCCLDDGSLDASFGTSGVVTHHSAAGGDYYDFGRSVCFDRSGRILVAGSSINGSDYDMALWRYLENGSLDTSFGNGGVVTYHNAAGGDDFDYGHSVCVDESGRILVAGFSDNGSDYDMALWRYMDDGSLDASFGTGGVVTHHNAAGGDYDDIGESVCLDGSGRIIVAGSSHNGSDNDMALWRYLEEGSLDESFGVDGIVRHHNAAGGDHYDYGYSVCLDGSGRVLVAGDSHNDNDSDMALWRYK